MEAGLAVKKAVAHLRARFDVLGARQVLSHFDDIIDCHIGF
jgi:hypothetical protein